MERKLTAIVAADVVNYSILIGQNELGTITALQTIQREIVVPAVTKYSGRIVRLMGDGTLLAFDSALDAVQFAVEIQCVLAERKTAKAEPPIELRMGVNLCDIIVGDGDIHGEGVNVAVRLEELAPAGGICLSHSIYLQTKNALGGQLLPIGERQLKNISEPVQVWRWQPPGVADGVGVSTDASAPKKHYHGRQILDPKVTAILVDLHIRSILLSISDCLDDIVAMPNTGTDMSVEEIYRRFGDHINHARQILSAISVEFVDNIQDFNLGLWQSPHSMSEFVWAVLDSTSTSFAARLLPEIQAILQLDANGLEKRTRVMTLFRTIVIEELPPRVKSAIKFAFVAP
jgi:class 3 adenylate cyclase